ncbi:MAG: FtsW/RodA/SpoVE family cell cycle protein [Bacteroidota bacterium]
MLKFLKNLKGDKVIWAVVFLLSMFSILAVYSSTGTLAYRNKAGNTEFYLLKHAAIMLMGFGLMYLSHLVKYTHYSRISQVALFIAVPLLLLTLVTGTSINDANRWLTLPVIDINFQTSDFAKLALIIYVARMLSKKQDQIKDFKSAFLPIMVPILLVCMLIFPANLSTAAILFATCIILMFIGRVNTKYILYLGGIMVLAMSIFILILMNSSNQGRVGTWKNRVETFFTIGGHTNPDDEYQVTQGKIAVATGGIFGKFPGNSTQRNYLPQAYSDFIYAIIVEEYGLIGGIVILLLYTILLFRAIRIATKCEKIFGALLVLGVSFTLVFQAMINMAIVAGLFPVTGQPLPLVSMGGTSLWFTSIAIGIMLSISREVEKENEEPETIPVKTENEQEYAAG